MYKDVVMTLFREINNQAFKLLTIVGIFFLALLQGCACSNDTDTCNYEAGTVALWSDNNEKLAVVVTDYGDSTSVNDNFQSIVTLDLDGRNIAHVYGNSNVLSYEYRLKSEQYLNYYSALKNYIILATNNHSGIGVRQYQRLDLDNLNLETLVTNDETCISRHVLPSLDGAVLAIIEVAGQENGFFVFDDPEYSNVRYKQYFDNADSNTGCNKLTMKVTLVDVDTKEAIAEFLNEEINLSYFVSRTNSMSVDLNMYWSNQGLIIKTNSQNKIYSIFNLESTTAVYDFPKNCYPLATSSSYVSQQNIEAKAFVILDNGIYSTDNKVELTDLSVKGQEYDSWDHYVPSVGQDICVL